MNHPNRDTLIHSIFKEIDGGLFKTFEPVTNLPLGPEFEAVITRLNQKRSAILDRIREDLAKFSDNELIENFACDGKPTTEHAQSVVTHFKADIQDVFGRLKSWYQIPIFRTKDLADFKYWGRSEFLSIYEVVWLSVGLEPNDHFKDAIKPYSATGSRQKMDNVAEYMSRHKEIIRRRFDPLSIDNKPDLNVLAQWIEAVQLDVHPDFKAILPDPQFALSKEKSDDGLPSEPLDGREKVSMSKLIAAMAIDGYATRPILL